jgi:hypothetical protein
LKQLGCVDEARKELEAAVVAQREAVRQDAGSPQLLGQLENLLAESEAPLASTIETLYRRFRRAVRRRDLEAVQTLIRENPGLHAHEGEAGSRTPARRFSRRRPRRVTSIRCGWRWSMEPTRTNGTTGAKSPSGTPARGASSK